MRSNWNPIKPQQPEKGKGKPTVREQKQSESKAESKKQLERRELQWRTC